MNLRKNLAFGCCVLLIAISVAACSKTADSSESSTAEVTGSPNMGSGNTQDSSTVYGKVTKINGNKITLALGSMQGGMGGGQAPSGKSNKSGGAAPSGTPGGNGKGGNFGAAPSGAPGGNGKGGNSGTVPSGAPGGNGKGGNMPGGMGGGFTQNGKTSTITIKDESLIKVISGNKESTGSLKSITKGSILTIKYTDSSKKTISQITVQKIVKGTAPGKNNTNSSSKSN